MRVLVVAPSAPPTNSPEALQVGRYLAELDRHADVHLVTTTRSFGWSRAEAGLQPSYRALTTHTLRLPWHDRATRLLATRPARRLLGDDATAWIAGAAPLVTRRLPWTPDVVYSRSLPFSAALLARSLQTRLRRPWVMHLSDPWVDNPYAAYSPRARERAERDERACFSSASAITVTTDGTAAFYRGKYPALAGRLHVSPNVMPAEAPPRPAAAEEARSALPGAGGPPPATPPAENVVELVYTGALYGARRPDALLDAIARLAPDVAAQIRLTLVGNIADDILAAIHARALPQVVVAGHVPYAESVALQARADVLVSLEPDGASPLLRTFLPSKLLDYVASGRPVLALTPEGSESARLVAPRHGWAFAPDDAAACARLLERCVLDRRAGRTIGPSPRAPLPDAHRPEVAVRALLDLFARLRSDVANPEATCASR
jgi:glycosyltransferase involved in cell wall biosynthesis